MSVAGAHMRRGRPRTTYVTPDRKRCSACRTALPVGMFWRDASRWDGRDARCRDCRGVKGPS